VSTLGKLTQREQIDDNFEAKLAALRATPAERARVLASAAPFDYEAWAGEVGPTTVEELTEMEEFLCEREAERRRSLVLEVVRGERVDE
jgi:hypothetical protein